MSDRLALCYHAISPSWSAPLSVSPAAFERQVSSLLADGWQAFTFAEVVRGTDAEKSLAITFDDAFASMEEHAVPILERLGVAATVFVPCEYVTRAEPLAWPGLGHWLGTADAHELTPMSWPGLVRLAEHGWEIGSHTRTHPRLTELDDEALSAELAGSRSECEARLGRPVTSIAYPFGDVDHRVQAEAERAGYEAAAALEWLRPPFDSHRFPRSGIYHGDSWRRFRLKTAHWTRTSLGSRLLARPS